MSATDTGRRAGLLALLAGLLAVAGLLVYRSGVEARVAAERESQEQLDDRTADAARLGAPDVRTGSLDRRAAS